MKWVLAILVSGFIGFTFFACVSYGIGGTYSSVTKNTEAEFEMAKEDYAVYLFGNTAYTETALEYFQGQYAASGASGIRFGFNIKPEINIGQFFAIFPLVGFSYPVYINAPEQLSGSEQLLDFAFKVGGGFDVSITRYFYLRAEAAYEPALLVSNKGWTAGIALGYRTDEDHIRNQWKTLAEIQARHEREKAERENEKAEREKKKEAQKKTDNVAKAKKALSDKDYAAAMNYYTRFIADDPETPEYYYGRSEVYSAQGEYEKALDDFTAAARLSIIIPDNWTSKWRDLFKKYKAEKNSPVALQGYGIWSLPRGQYLKLEPVKNADFKASSGNGNEAMLPVGKRTLTFSYTGSLGTVSYIGDISVSFDVVEGHIYSTSFGFDGQYLITTIEDVTGKELGTDEAEKTVATVKKALFNADRFKPGMSLAEIKRAFPGNWEKGSTTVDGSGQGYSLSSGTTRDNSMVRGVTLMNDKLDFYRITIIKKYYTELYNLAKNYYGEPYDGIFAKSNDSTSHLLGIAFTGVDPTQISVYFEEYK